MVLPNVGGHHLIHREQEKTNAIAQVVRKKEFSLIHWRLRLFVLFRPSTDWTRPTYITEGNLLDS